MVVNSLSPASQLNKTVDGSQLAPQDLLALGILHGVDTSDIIDGNHAVGGWGCKVKTLVQTSWRERQRQFDINVYSKH